jgi:glycosyltransferase involved in cell wall biosynthesis
VRQHPQIITPNLRSLRIALVGNHPPRRCGIATYTRDVAAALRAAGHAVHVSAMSEPGSAHEYGDAVDLIVPRDLRAGYAAAGRAIARWRPDVVLVQHEFGIFGGPAGLWLTDLLDAARVPAIVQLHTVLARPDRDQRAAMDALHRRVAGIVVMALGGRDMLQRAFGTGVPIDVIPHGVPDLPPMRPAAMRRRLGWPERPTLLTFGLLSPGKGIETAIEALPAILERVPDARYVLLGATHPALLAQEGERYRDGLAARACQLGVDHALRMENCYVDDNDLCDALRAADLYVTPYVNPEQITSGTLAYALACGVPTVSTPYRHAEEVLEPDLLFPFGDAGALAARAVPLLSRPSLRDAVGHRLWTASRPATWSVQATRLGEALRAAARSADMLAIPAE